MTEPVTPNKGFTVPNTGDLLNAWGGPINTNFTNIDTALAGAQSIALTTGGTVTMTAAQAQFLATSLTGALSANSIFQVPQVGGFYLLNNASTGAYTVTCQTGAAGGATVTLRAGWNGVFTDGTNVYMVAQPLSGTVSININGTVGATTPSTGAFTTAKVTTLEDGGANLLVSSTAPTITSGFGTSPSIVANNTAAFQVIVGTGGTDSSGTIGFPNAPNGWSCSVSNITTSGAVQTIMSSASPNLITLKNINTTTGSAQAWNPGDKLNIQCTAF